MEKEKISGTEYTWLSPSTSVLNHHPCFGNAKTVGQRRRKMQVCKFDLLWPFCMFLQSSSCSPLQCSSFRSFQEASGLKTQSLSHCSGEATASSLIPELVCCGEEGEGRERWEEMMRHLALHTLDLYVHSTDVYGLLASGNNCNSSIHRQKTKQNLCHLLLTLWWSGWTVFF